MTDSAQNAWRHPGHSAAARSAVSAAFEMYASRLGLLHFEAAHLCSLKVEPDAPGCATWASSGHVWRSGWMWSLQKSWSHLQRMGRKSFRLHDGNAQDAPTCTVPEPESAMVCAAVVGGRIQGAWRARL